MANPTKPQLGGLSPHSQKFATIQIDGKPVKFPAAQHLATDIYVEGQLHCRVVADLAWADIDTRILIETTKNGQGQNKVKFMRVENIQTDVTVSTAKYGTVKARLDLRPDIWPLDDLQPAITTALASSSPITADVFTLLFQAGPQSFWSGKIIANLIADMWYLGEGSVLPLHGLAKISSTHTAHILEAIPLITVSKASRKGIPLYKFGQLKHLVLAQTPTQPKPVGVPLVGTQLTAKV